MATVSAPISIPLPPQQDLFADHNALQPANVDGSQRSGQQASSRSRHSPMPVNGSFECDRVIKFGEVLKRTRKTKSWRPVYLVLRPNILSIYKDPEATRLRHKLNLSELTAVARQRDPKGKAKHVFGIFSPERNFHFDAKSDEEAQAWVGLIRSEARIDEGEDEMMLMRPSNSKDMQSQTMGDPRNDEMMPNTGQNRHQDIYSSFSESEPAATRHWRSANSPYQARQLHSAVRNPAKAQHTDLSSNEGGSFSDFSDFPGSATSLSHTDRLPPTITLRQPENEQRPKSAGTLTSGQGPALNASRPPMHRSASAVSVSHAARDSERVAYHGYLHLLRSKNKIRAWKPYWCVLRPKCLGLYKDESEYSALFIIPFSSILDAVEVDAQGGGKVLRKNQSKDHCLQIITEERSYKFAAANENELAKWLGALKCLLSKRRDAQNTREVAAQMERSAEITGHTEGAAIIEEQSRKDKVGKTNANDGHSTDGKTVSFVPVGVEATAINEGRPASRRVLMGDQTAQTVAVR